MKSKAIEIILEEAEHLKQQINADFLTLVILREVFSDLCMAESLDTWQPRTGALDVSETVECLIIRAEAKKCGLNKKTDKEQLISELKSIPDAEQERQSQELTDWLNDDNRTVLDLFHYVVKQLGLESIKQDSGNDEEKTDGEEKPKDPKLEKLKKLMAKAKEEKKSEKEESDESNGSNESDESQDIINASDDVRLGVEELANKAVELREKLLERIIGQNNAVSGFIEGYFEGELNAVVNEDRKGPKSVFLFAGSPGVGKTFLATQVAEILGIPSMRFDMSAYSHENQVLDLTGCDENYKVKKAGELTGFVSRNPESVLIFDEIEKAHSNIVNLFLQILDRGTLRDTANHKEAYFNKTIVIFTTNAGKQLYSDSGNRKLSSIPKKVILDALGKDINPNSGKPFFPQALCSRMASGTVLMFDHLSAHDLSAIAEKNFEVQQDRLSKAFDIDCTGSENLATTSLFAAGGNCDARTLVGSVKKMFSEEIFELLRLKRTKSEIKEIKWELDLSGAAQHVKELYELPEDICFVLFGDEKKRALAENWKGNGKCVYASSVDEATEILDNNEVCFVALDYLYGASEDEKFMNAEDVTSEGKKLLEIISSNYADVPAFIWENGEYEYSREEKMSLLKRSAYDIIHVFAEPEDDGVEIINELQVQLWQEKAMDVLRTKHQVISYETSQTVSEDETKGVIRVFDVRLRTAVETEDQKAILAADEKPNKHWEDVVVSEDAKNELQFFQEYLQSPKSFIKKGAKVPKGILLYGPPGTGKTSLAKVMATEADVTFLSVSAEQFLSKWVGEGPQNVHNIFSTARKYAPAILFIDEIDAIASRRTEGDTNKQSHEILNALLTEMDGFKTTPNKPVLVMAATNLGGNNGNTGALDPALVRRFDRSICIDLPDKNGRKKLINILCKNNPIIKISEDTVESLAERAIGMSPALIEGALNAAIRDAIRAGTFADDEIVDEAFEKYNNGEEKQWDKAQLEKTARHEAGHALVCAYYGGEPSYLTIVARDNHGGYMMNSSDEGKGTYTKNDLLHRICTSMGGRAAELVYYGNEAGMTTGPSGDLQNATTIAKRMICNYGMVEEISFGVISDEQLAGEMGVRVNSAINSIISAELNNAIRIIEANKATMDKLVNELMEKAHLNKDEILKITSNVVFL